MEATKTCKFCGRSGFVWRRLGQDRWALYELDAQGRASINHTASCRVGRGQVAGAPYTSGAAETADAAEVQAMIDANVDAISGFVDAAAAQLVAQAEAVADKVDAPVIPTYNVTPGTAKADSDIPVPTLDAGHLWDAEHLATVKTVLALANDTGHPQNIGLRGEAGGGKTAMAIQIGALHGGPTIVIDSTDKESATDWFGTQTLKDGTVTFDPSDFVRAVETEGAVIVLDDVALLQSQKVESGLNALLDPSRRAIFIQQLGRVVQCAPRTIFVGTWNEGDEYRAASELSKQIIDRFRAGALFEVEYPDSRILTHIIRTRSGCPKAAAQRLADVAAWLRADPEPIVVSTRGLIAAGNLVRKGRSIGAALFFTCFGELDEEERQRAYTIIGTEARRAGYPETEAALWAAPVMGRYVTATGAVVQ